MTKLGWMPDRTDRITWSITAVCVAAMLLAMAVNGMVGLGEVAHDAFCPDHGWAVSSG